MPLGLQPVDQRRLQLRAGQPAVIADRHRAAAAARDDAAEAAADGEGVSRGQRAADDAADVVFAQRRRIEIVWEKLMVRSLITIVHVMLQEAAHRIGEIRALQGVGDLRLQKADLVAAVEPSPS